tara:strand:+ start:1835 stop:2344 length:510 start_codon:yes stop_codon:yes gene_type:complete
VPKDILEAAGLRGTAVHKYIEGILDGWDFSVIPPNLLPYIDSWRLFWDSSKHAFEGKITLEKRLYCDEHKITGQADVIVETEDRTYIIDWKTSSVPQKSWALQGAAYKHLAEVNGYKNVDSVLFVKLLKNGKTPSLHKHENHEENLEIFFKCLDLYQWFEMSKTRKQWK